MFSKIALTVLLIFIVSINSFGQTASPLPADKIMAAAFEEAKDAGKNVFLIFHASWCGWCKRLDKAMQSEELKKIFDDNFIITHLDVQERGDKIASLENPGGLEIMKKLGGEKSGLPFYAFLNPDGVKIGDSNVMPKEMNIGYPGSDAEIVAFGMLLKLSAPKMEEAQLNTILDYLRKNAPKS